MIHDTRYMMRDSGFVVLTSVIILSVVLLLIAQAASTSGYFQSAGALDFEFKELSYSLALSCIDRAYYNLSQDLDYAGNEDLAIGGYTCRIDPVTVQGLNTTFQSSATAETSTTKLKMTIDQNFTITSFQEQ